MNWLLDALFRATFLWIPTWVYAVLIIVALIVVYRLIGWKAALAGGIAGLVFLATVFGSRKGAESERAKQQRVDQKARDTITKVREDVADDTDAELDARLSRWTREDRDR